jgi:hypothetical protein
MRPLPLAALAGAALLLPTATASADTLRCGEVNGGFEYKIRAEGVTCAVARRTAKRWHAKAVGAPLGRSYIGNFMCLATAREGFGEHVRVRCANGEQKVRFFAGP